MNPALFANPQIFGAYQNDPRNGYAQALMQQGTSGAPVRSPLEGLARALQAGVGGYMQGQTRRDYEGQGEDYRKGLAAALQGNDVLGALSKSENPYLQQTGMQAQLQKAMQPGEKDPLVKVFDQASGAEKWVKTSEAAGLQATGPDKPIISGGMMRDPVTGEWKPIPGYTEQQAAIAAAGRAPGPATTEPDKVRLARAAGLQEGSPEWKAFLTGDKENSKQPSAKDLRDEYTKGLKDYNEALNGFTKVVEAAKDPSPAGDLALIFGYMKTLDPTSTVREGEFATAQNSGSVPTQIQALYNRLQSGERLTADQRADFVGSAKTQFGVYDQRKQLADQFYSDLAKRNSINPQDVLVPYPAMPSITPNGPQNPRTIRIDAQGNEIP